MATTATWALADFAEDLKSFCKKYSDYKPERKEEMYQDVAGLAELYSDVKDSYNIIRGYAQYVEKKAAYFEALKHHYSLFENELLDDLGNGVLLTLGTPDGLSEDDYAEKYAFGEKHFTAERLVSFITAKIQNAKGG